MIHLDARDARPICEQVVSGLRRLIVSGGLGAGEKLPSVRVLASMLAINPNTIAKAYEALESDGYLYTEAGRGCFASHGPGPDSGRRRLLLARFDETAGELLFLGVTAAELIQRLPESGGAPPKPLEEENPANRKGGTGDDSSK